MSKFFGPSAPANFYNGGAYFSPLPMIFCRVFLSSIFLEMKLNRETDQKLWSRSLIGYKSRKLKVILNTRIVLKNPYMGCCAAHACCPMAVSVTFGPASNQNAARAAACRQQHHGIPTPWQ